MMKKSLYIIFPVFMLCFTACEKKVSPDEIKETLSSGTWHVSYYSFEANPSFVFSNYDFRFLEGGVLNVQGDGTDLNGDWSVAKVDGDNVLDLYLGHSSPFDELDNDWEIRSNSSSRIETENNDNGTVYLTFEKN